MDEIVMNVILNAGNARSKCFLALKAARKREFEEAKEIMKEVNQFIVKAHKVQTNLIQEEARGNKQPVSLLLVHAQDHLMTALAIRDLADEMITYMEMNEVRMEALEGEVS